MRKQSLKNTHICDSTVKLGSNYGIVSISLEKVFCKEILPKGGLNLVRKILGSFVKNKRNIISGQQNDRDSSGSFFRMEAWQVDTECGCNSQDRSSL